MTPAPLNYAPRERFDPFWKKWRFVIIASLIVLAFIFTPVVELRRVHSRVDALSGSMEYQTTWPFGISGTPVIQPSALEKRLHAIGITWTRDWRFLHTRHQNIFGGTMGYGCSTAPPIYSYVGALQPILDESTDDEVRALLQALQQADDDEQEKVLRTAFERVIP